MLMIKQQKPNECALACIAMVTGVEYEKARENLPERARKNLEDNEGIYYSDALMTLGSLGFDFDFVSLEKDESFPHDNKMVAILTVPSKNKENCLHSIVYNGGSILDPSKRNTYDNISDTIDHIIDYTIIL